MKMHLRFSKSRREADARIHLESCHIYEHRKIPDKWRGPFDTFEDAEEFAKSKSRPRIKKCSKCFG